MIHLYAAAGNLFSMGDSLISKLGHLALSGLALVVGVVAAGHVARHNPGAAIAVVALAIIPAWFFLDPHGAVHTLTSTVSGL